MIVARSIRLCYHTFNIGITRASGASGSNMGFAGFLFAFSLVRIDPGANGEIKGLLFNGVGNFPKALVDIGSGEGGLTSFASGSDCSSSTI